MIYKDRLSEMPAIIWHKLGYIYRPRPNVRMNILCQ